VAARGAKWTEILSFFSLSLPAPTLATSVTWKRNKTQQPAVLIFFHCFRICLSLFFRSASLQICSSVSFLSPSPLHVVGRRKDGCWSVGGAVFRLPVVEVPAAVWLGGGRFCEAASPLLLVAGRGSVDGAAGSVGVSLRLAFPRPREAAVGEGVNGRWREWNRLGEGRGRWGYGGGWFVRGGWSGLYWQRAREEGVRWWFCFPRERRLGEDDWKWGLKVKRGGGAAGLCEQGKGGFRPPLFSLNFFYRGCEWLPG